MYSLRIVPSTRDDQDSRPSLVQAVAITFCKYMTYRCQYRIILHVRPLASIRCLSQAS